MTMQFGEKEKQLLLGFIAFVLIALSVKFAWMDLFNDKSNALKEEIKPLESEVKILREYDKKSVSYKKEISAFTAKSNAIVAKYAANNTQEYLLLFLRDLETENNWINVYNLPQDPTNQSIKTMDSKILTAVVEPTTIEFVASYGDAKQFIRAVNENVKKCGFSNISLNYDDQTKLLKGKALFNFYSIVGGDRVPEQANIFSVLYGKGQDGLFTSSTFSPDITTTGMSNIDRIRTDSDFFVLVNPYGSSLDSVIAGFTSDKTGNSLISGNGNKEHTVVIKVSGSNNDYSIEYQVDEKKQAATKFVAGDTIDILLSSSVRVDDVDKVTCKVRVENTSDRTVNVGRINDDMNNARIFFEHSGDVTVH